MASDTVIVETRTRVYDSDGNIISETVRTQNVDVNTVEEIRFGEGGYGEGPYGGGQADG